MWFDLMNKMDLSTEKKIPPINSETKTDSSEESSAN